MDLPAPNLRPAKLSTTKLMMKSTMAMMMQALRNLMQKQHFFTILQFLSRQLHKLIRKAELLSENHSLYYN